MRFEVPEVLSMIALGSERTTGSGELLAVGRLNCSATNTVKAMANAPMASRAYFLNGSFRGPVPRLVQSGKPVRPVSLPDIRERQLNVGLSIVLILLERKGDVDGALVLGEIVVLLGGAPGDRAEDAAILLQRHFEVALFELAWAIDDLDPPRRKHR